jgi:hypothetical protein
MTGTMTKSDLNHILDALECAEAEFEELMIEREWYVTNVTDRIQSAKQIIIQELEKYARK